MKFDIWANRVGVILGVISTLFTIVVAIFGFNIDNRLKETELQLTTAQTKLVQVDAKTKEISSGVEVSRDRTERIQFVNSILPKLIDGDEKEKILVSNMISLTLSEEEAEKLFLGLASSDNDDISGAGKEAIKTVNKTKSEVARTYELLGIDALIDGDMAAALTYYLKAEQTFPQYHWAYEISNLIRENKDSLTHPEIQKRIRRKVSTDHSAYIPADKLNELKSLSQQE